MTSMKNTKQRDADIMKLIRTVLLVICAILLTVTSNSESQMIHSIQNNKLLPTRLSNSKTVTKKISQIDNSNTRVVSMEDTSKIWAVKAISVEEAEVATTIEEEACAAVVVVLRVEVVVNLDQDFNMVNNKTTLVVTKISKLSNANFSSKTVLVNLEIDVPLPMETKTFVKVKWKTDLTSVKLLTEWMTCKTSKANSQT